jgi:hypothetical protein
MEIDNEIQQITKAIDEINSKNMKDHIREDMIKEMQQAKITRQNSMNKYGNEQIQLTQQIDKINQEIEYVNERINYYTNLMKGTSDNNKSKTIENKNKNDKIKGEIKLRFNEIAIESTKKINRQQEIQHELESIQQNYKKMLDDEARNYNKGVLYTNIFREKIEQPEEITNRLKQGKLSKKYEQIYNMVEYEYNRITKQYEQEKEDYLSKKSLLQISVKEYMYQQLPNKILIEKEKLENKLKIIRKKKTEYKDYKENAKNLQKLHKSNSELTEKIKEQKQRLKDIKDNQISIINNCKAVAMDNVKRREKALKYQKEKLSKNWEKYKLRRELFNQKKEKIMNNIRQKAMNKRQETSYTSNLEQFRKENKNKIQNLIYQHEQIKRNDKLRRRQQEQKKRQSKAKHFETLQQDYMLDN